MTRTHQLLGALALTFCGYQLAGVTLADEAPADNRFKKPVHRIAKNIDEKAISKANHPGQHPIDPALQKAHEILQHIRQNVVDYTATLIKRETINGKLTEREFMFVKIRNRKAENGRTIVPLSLYMKYLKPSAKKGQEAIWVEGNNNNKIVGHGTGLQGLFTVYLDPDGFIATRGTNYAIYDSGIENLVVKLIDRGNQDRATQRGNCEVQFYQNAKIGDRVCTLIQLTHPTYHPDLDFHVARIFVDDELQVPIRFAAYSFPKQPNGQPQIIEEFTYTNLKLNVGLTDADFDPKNPNYNYR